MSAERKQARNLRAERAEARLALPVVVAALVSIPAVFLTAAPGWPRDTGKVLNWFSAIVLTGEPILLFLLSGHRLRWLRRHLWQVLIGVIAVPVMTLLFAPLLALRALRLMHLVMALRLLRVNKILGAADALRRRLGMNEMWGRVETGIAALIGAGFAAVVLTNPHSVTRRLIHAEIQRFGQIPVIIAIALAGTVALVMLRYLSRLAMLRARAWWATRHPSAESPATMPTADEVR